MNNNKLSARRESQDSWQTDGKFCWLIHKHHTNGAELPGIPRGCWPLYVSFCYLYQIMLPKKASPIKIFC